MNKEEILAMEVGRELDELIERELFGLVRGYREDGSRCWKDSEGHPVQSEAKPYSTIIEVALQALDEINKRYGIMLTFFDPSQPMYPAYKVLCEICDPVVLDDSVIAKSYGNTAPEAICKAALLTKLGVE